MDTTVAQAFEEVQNTHCCDDTAGQVHVLQRAGWEDLHIAVAKEIHEGEEIYPDRVGSCVVRYRQ